MLRNKLDKVIEIYNASLSVMRYNAARELNGNVKEVPNVDIAMRAALKEIGIEDKNDLAREFNLEGIESKMLEFIQTPYFERKVETEEEIKEYGKGRYIQVENTGYAHPYKGFTFDDVYAVRKMFEVLPEGTDYHKTNYNSYNNWIKPIKDEQDEKHDMEESEKEYDRAIKEFFAPLNTSILGWNPNKDAICSGSIEERVELKFTLASKLLDVKPDLDYVGKVKLLAEWYHEYADGNSNVRIWKYKADEVLKEVA